MVDFLRIDPDLIYVAAWGSEPLKDARPKQEEILKWIGALPAGEKDDVLTTFDLTGDPRWDEGGDLLELYDLELEKQTAVRSVLGPEEVFTGVYPVFTPALNTVKEDEIFNIIEFSGDEPDGVNVLTQIQGDEGNIFEKAQEEPGNGHGNPVDALFKGFEGALL
jgi:hypothetical protein